MRKHHLQSDLRRYTKAVRGGFVLMWIIVAIPAMVFLFGMMIDLSRVWIARIELTNALEAAALSGIKSWAEASNNNPSVRSGARQAAVQAAAANTVTGLNPYSLGTSPTDAVAVVLNVNSQSGSPNENKSNAGDIVLGQLSSSGPGFIFNPNAVPAAKSEFGVRAQKTKNVYSIWNSLFGIPLGPYGITSGATAIYDGQPRIVHVVSYVP